MQTFIFVNAGLGLEKDTQTLQTRRQHLSNQGGNQLLIKTGRAASTLVPHLPGCWFLLTTEKEIQLANLQHQ